MPLSCRAVFLVFGLCLGFGLAAAPAAAADIVIPEATVDWGDGAKIKLKTITLKDCNLTQDEAVKLFSGGLTREDAGAMLARMTAGEAHIAEADMTTGAGDHLTVKDIAAQAIAQGGAENLTIAATEGVIPDDAGDSYLHFGALRINRVALSDLVAALQAGDPALAALRFSHLAWDGGDISVVDKGTPAGAPGGNRIKLQLGAGADRPEFRRQGRAARRRRLDDRPVAENAAAIASAAPSSTPMAIPKSTPISPSAASMIRRPKSISSRMTRSS